MFVLILQHHCNDIPSGLVHPYTVTPNILELKKYTVSSLELPWKIFHNVLHFPVTISIEPEITELEVDQSVPEIILNLNSSMASRGSTFDIDLPQISTPNGPFRLVCIIYKVNKCEVCEYLQSFLHHCGDQ